MYPTELIEIENFLKQKLVDNELHFCNKIGDGRINSVSDENTIINLLKKEFQEMFIEAPPRCWYDFCLKLSSETNLFVNIKVSRGGTDNAFNKKAIVYSLTENVDVDQIPNNMSFNKLYDYLHLDEYKRTTRDTFREYYYLYIDKEDHTVIIKSLLDIEHFVSNPCNILQINWKKEKKCDVMLNNTDTAREKIGRIIEASLNTFITGSNKFINRSIH